MRPSPILLLQLSLTVLAVFARLAAADPPATDEVPIPSFPEQIYRQWTVEPVAPKPELRDFLRTSDQTLERLSLRQAVTTALENNPGIAVQRLGPQFARAEIDRASGVFDPLFKTYGQIDRRVTPADSVLAGALEVREREYKFGASIEKLLRTGARFSVAYDSTEIDSNSRFVGLRPKYKPEVVFSATQPLLRNFGLDLTILLVRSAEAGSSVAYYQYESSVTALVRQVVEAYWGVVQTRENLKAEEDGLRFAQTLERENAARVRAGVLPPIAVKEAAAEAARREEQVIVAANATAVATERLRLLLQHNPDRAFLPREIEPADSPEVRAVDVDEQEILENAVNRRPEVLRVRYEIESRRILAKVKRNNLLPALDLTADYGLNGLSGRGVPQQDFLTGQTTTTPFTGNYGDSVDRLFSDNFNSYTARLSLTVPLSNTTAKAEYTQSQIDARRAEFTYRQLLADVTLEVRKTIGDVRSNSKRITATRLARELAEESLEQENKRYAVGLATTKDILDFQEKLTAARAAETRALIDYNVSLAALRQAGGTLLQQFDIVLGELPPSPTPLWARF